ncbi:FABP family protein [uncultured Pseudokineococcus sp.]|uniref:FABP family protein n=1 Tax=uncultured Pseudokineococcus sp. TaxID=1642928 RepID=UPI002611C228|nr:FABP family protein [uncultured Pseudokineococcus sp.]
MPFEIRADLPASLVPLAWMEGRWEGAGVVGYDDVPERRFGQEVVLAHDGRGGLAYRAQSWYLDDDGTPTEPMTSESGVWRTGDDGSGGVQVELLLAQPEGAVEIYVGRASGTKVELTTDLVARTSTSTGTYTAGQRIYGAVDGDLLWALDVATPTTPMRSYASARLKKV